MANRPNMSSKELQGSSKPKKKEGKRSPRRDGLSVKQIVSRFGGTLVQWNALIREGILNGNMLNESSEIRVREADVRKYVAQAVTRQLDNDVPPLPKIEIVEGVARVVGSSVPLALLEKARQSGASEAALRDAFPGLPERVLEAVTDYINGNPTAVEKWTNELAPTTLPPDEQDDDDVGFDAELEELLESDAELFHRLAR